MKKKETGCFVNKTTENRARALTEYRAGRLSRGETALILGLSERQVSRLASRYEREGLYGLRHLNQHQLPTNKVPTKTKELISELLKSDYSNFNLEHAREMLMKQHQVKISYSTLWRIAKKIGYHKSLRRRSKVRHYRHRYANEGFMLQMDGSHHKWNGKAEWCLMAAIDDATNDIPYGEFFGTEDLESSLKIIRKICEIKGIPRVLYVDRASWFSGTVKSKNMETAQFKRICDELGMQVIYANSPEAKGRIERAWRTLQDRLSAELQYQKINTKEEATTYFNEKFLPETWRAKWLQPPLNPESFYRPQPIQLKLKEVMCKKFYRKINPDHTLRWLGLHYKITAELRHSLAGRTAEIRVYADGSTRAVYNDLDLKMVAIDPPSRLPQIA